MSRHTHWACVALLLTSAAAVRGQEVRYTEENGVTYRETRQVVRRQIPEVQYHDSERTVLRGQWRSDTQDVVRTYQVPITEYRWEAQWHGRYNPFVQPHVAYHLVPHTRWETRTETAKMPVTRYETVPEKRTEKIPVTTWRTVEDQVTSRVAVAVRPQNVATVVQQPAPGAAAAGMARYGESGTSSNEAAWRTQPQAGTSGSTTQLSR